MKNQHVDRRRLLGVALVAFLLLTTVVLADVINTVVFAVTVAYVLFPLRQMLVDRGYSERLATLSVTAGAAFSIVALAVPAAYVVYRRRSTLVDLVRSLPDRIPVEIGGFSYVIVTTDAVPAVQALLGDIALNGVSTLAVLAFKSMVFALVIYGVLARPYAVKRAVYGLVPVHYHDIVAAYHERTRATLLGIYVVQAATAVATTGIALLVFVGLGYDSALTLAIAAGALQFIPVLGPSVIIAALAAMDLVGGNAPRAVLVLVVGLFVVGFLPDAVLRPRLANLAADLPTTLYFVGFVGGVLTLGVVGFVVGPLVVALLVETVELLSTELDPHPEADDRVVGTAGDSTADSADL